VIKLVNLDKGYEFNILNSKLVSIPMPIVELKMPKMGESISEATILNWLKKVGDRVEEDETILEVATDKVDTEVPAPCNGILTQIRFEMLKPRIQNQKAKPQQ